MVTLATRVKTYLLTDTTIVSAVSDRIYDREIRGAGPDAPSVLGPSGYTLTHVIIDDAGGGSAPFGPSGAFNDRLNVWILAENSTTGRSQIEALTARIIVKLHRWFEVNGKQQVFFADRTGFVPDPLPDTGAQERLTFSVAGTFAGVAT
jgi:hypothetical protein